MFLDPWSAIMPLTSYLLPCLVSYYQPLCPLYFIMPHAECIAVLTRAASVSCNASCPAMHPVSYSFLSDLILPHVLFFFVLSFHLGLPRPALRSTLYLRLFFPGAGYCTLLRILPQFSHPFQNMSSLVPTDITSDSSVSTLDL
jgi:hypothetical protein